MQISVIRNTETQAEREDRFEGLHDTPVTDDGLDTTRTVGSTLADREYDILYSSPLKRALDTAKIIAQEVHTDVRITPELRGVCYGDWEGRPRSELRDTDEWSQREADTYNFTHPGSYEGTTGQSHADIYDRTVDYFEQLQQREYDNVVVVTHLGVLRNLKRHFEGVSDEVAGEFTPTATQVYEIEIAEEDVTTNLRDYAE